jgi:FkbM family methyltransferase
MIGETTLSWKSVGTETVEVRIGAPYGPLFSRTGPSGSASTGKWVINWTVFYLQDVSGGLPLTSENTLNRLTVNVISAEEFLSKSSEKMHGTNNSAVDGISNTREFQHWLLFSLLSDCFEFRDQNTDFLRFPTSKPDKLKTWIIEKLLLLARKNGLVRRHFSIEKVSGQLMHALYDDKMEKFYNLLGDEYSRNLLIELLKFRMLGPRHVRLPLNNKKYRDMFVWIKKEFLKQRRTIKAPFDNLYLDHYTLPRAGGTLNLHSDPESIINIFLLKQYAYQQAGKECHVNPGDVVIDGGACWGDTSLCFADGIGEHGQVYSFEFVPDNLEILMKNIDLNPHLKNRVKVIRKALWDKSGEYLGYEENGPVSYVCEDNQKVRKKVATLSIDDFVRAEVVSRVNFIKMDIEGAELNALRGAEQTICTFRPVLAIALYHKEDDFTVIPDYLDTLSLQYEFYIDHFTTHAGETILFAVPRRVDSLSEFPQTF